MMSDLIKDVTVYIQDDVARQYSFEEAWKALHQTGPLLWEGAVYTATFDEYQRIECSVQPFAFVGGNEHTGRIMEVTKGTDEELGARFGYRLASQTPIPV